ncbi:hypothetical protein KKC60_02460 [Patescibacteria group bacterium]|nr:hypothetical protein [Patescibacteria group bacterium]
MTEFKKSLIVNSFNTDIGVSEVCSLTKFLICEKEKKVKSIFIFLNLFFVASAPSTQKIKKATTALRKLGEIPEHNCGVLRFMRYRTRVLIKKGAFKKSGLTKEEMLKRISTPIKRGVSCYTCSSLKKRLRLAKKAAKATKVKAGQLLWAIRRSYKIRGREAREKRRVFFAPYREASYEHARAKVMIQDTRKLLKKYCTKRK